MIVGSRERRATADDKSKIETIIAELLFEHGTRLTVASANCDAEIGKIIFDVCAAAGVKMVEMRIYLHDASTRTSIGSPDRRSLRQFDKRLTDRLFAARNNVLVEIGDLFYFFTGRNASGLVEMMIPRAIIKVHEKRVKVYPEGARETA